MQHHDQRSASKTVCDSDREILILNGMAFSGQRVHAFVSEKIKNGKSHKTFRTMSCVI